MSQAFVMVSALKCFISALLNQKLQISSFKQLENRIIGPEFFFLI